MDSNEQSEELLPEMTGEAAMSVSMGGRASSNRGSILRLVPTVSVTPTSGASVHGDGSRQPCQPRTDFFGHDFGSGLAAQLPFLVP